MKAMYCKKSNIVTIKLKKSEYNDLTDEFDNEDWDMIGNIIDNCEIAIAEDEGAHTGTSFISEHTVDRFRRSHRHASNNHYNSF